MRSDVFDEAIRFAVQAHAGMTRKSGQMPYILHPMEAAAIVGTMTSDPEILAAAVLHDVVEDAGVSLETLQRLFGRRVMELVASETENKRSGLPAEQTWMTRKSEAIALLKATHDPGVRMIYLGDKLSNLRSLYRGWKEQGEGFWLAFHQTDPRMHLWYYRAIADALCDLAGTAAWQEFEQLITRMETMIEGEGE